LKQESGRTEEKEDRGKRIEKEKRRKGEVEKGRIGERVICTAREAFAKSAEQMSEAFTFGQP